MEIAPGISQTLPEVTLCTDQPEKALELAKELLGEPEYSWQTTEPQA